MPKDPRQQRDLDSGAAAGLVRVEVLVPADDRPKVLEFAAALRQSHRPKQDWTDEHERLFTEATSRYQARCLWNVNPDRNRSGLALIADRLRANGGMDAWKLASAIRESRSHALKHEGMVEATVFSETEGTSRIQWVEASAYNFFAPAPDDELGWRLHMADIATGKALAAGGRRQVRDYVDLTLIHEHILPLWHVLWAAPGKDSQWSPLSLAEKISRTNQFAQPEIDREIASLIAISASSVGITIREAIEEAREVFEKLPSETAGCLFVDAQGEPARSVDAVLEPASRYRPIQAQHGGAWPSGPDMDRALITRIIERYGFEGSKLIGKEDDLPGGPD